MSMRREMDAIQGDSPSYYRILGVRSDSSPEEIRRAYRKLAMQRWHPDKWTKTPLLSDEANHKFQQIQEAYSVLSDKRKRTMYDAGLYESDDEEDEGFADFLQEMRSLMAEARREDKPYNMKELESMFWDMAQSFEFPEWSSPSQAQQQVNWFCSPQPPIGSSHWFCGQFPLDDSRTSKRARWDNELVADKGSHLQVSGLDMYGTSQFCR